MTFARYYQAELGYVRDVGRAFGQSHPAIAGMLTERGGDPDVQRLIEGFAFLSARIRQRIDQAVPALTESLTELLLPQFVQTVPASTIVQFAPPPRGLRGRQRVARGTELAARPREGTSCLFRTSEDVELVPASLARQYIDDAHPARPRMTLELSIAKGGHEAVFSGPLRFHLHGEYAYTSLLYLWIARYCRKITLSCEGRTVVASTSALSMQGFDTPMWPWPPFAPPAYRLLLEYFTYPQKLLFFELGPMLEACAFQGESVQITLEFERPPPLPGPLPQDTLRLHCVSVANLFEATAEPIRWHALCRPQLLRASGVDPAHMEVHSVGSVTGVLSGGGRCTYQPFLGFAHDWDRAETYYAVSRELSPVDDGVHHFLSLATPHGGDVDLTAQTLSIDLTCTNRSLPNELGVGDVCVPTSSSPTGVAFTNIGLISRPVRPPLGSMTYPRLLAHLAASRREVTDVDALRALLRLYNLQQHAEHASGRVNEARIAAVERISAQPVTRVVQGAPVRGTRLSVEARAEGFVSMGDAYLFASVLDRCFGMRVAVNTFAELAFELLPSNEVFAWRPRWRS